MPCDLQNAPLLSVVSGSEVHIVVLLGGRATVVSGSEVQIVLLLGGRARHCSDILECLGQNAGQAWLPPPCGSKKRFATFTPKGAPQVSQHYAEQRGDTGREEHRIVRLHSE